MDLVKQASYTNAGNKCFLDIRPSRLYGDDPPVDPFFFSIGAAFARHYCAVLDADNNRFGIAANLINKT